MISNRPRLVFAANVQRYDCGCVAEWQFIGAFSHIPEYHIIPCYFHSNHRKIMEEIAAKDWEQLMDNVHK